MVREQKVADRGTLPQKRGGNKLGGGERPLMERILVRVMVLVERKNAAQQNFSRKLMTNRGAQTGE